MRTRIEHGAHAGDPDRAHIRIETVEDYERATRRIAALDSAARSEGEERKRNALIEAVKQWDGKHDDATRWRD